MLKKTTVKKETKIPRKKTAKIKVETLIEKTLPSSPTIPVTRDPATYGSPSTMKEKYYEAVGRRKESIARVRLYTKKAQDVTDLPTPTGEERALITVNGKNYRDYFTDANLWNIVESSLKKLKSINRFKATVIVRGGGKSGQADAIKHGLARTLIEFDNNFRKKLKKSGYLTRDPRAKERRKYGLKKARKAPRWAKR